jgi:hypothetical protein
MTFRQALADLKVIFSGKYGWALPTIHEKYFLTLSGNWQRWQLLSFCVQKSTAEARIFSPRLSSSKN